MSATKQKLENVLENIEFYSLYHKFALMFIFLITLPCGYMNFSSVFVLDVPYHRCYIPAIDKVQNESASYETLRRYIPTSEENSEQISQCKRYTDVQEGTNSSEASTSNMTKECSDGWFYNDTNDKTTATMEFDLICENDWQRVLLTFGFTVGALFAGIITGTIYDRFGRRKPIIVMCLGVCVSLLTYSFSPNYIVCVCCFTMSGACSTAAFFGCFVLAQELVRKQHRAIASCLFYMLLSTAYTILPLVAYLVDDWRWILRINGLFCFVFVPYIWVLPESPRWLMVKSRLSEAQIILKKLAPQSEFSIELTPELILTPSSDEEIRPIFIREHLSTYLPTIRRQFKKVGEQNDPQLQNERKDTENISFKTIFQNSILRRRTMVLCWLWVVSFVCYYVFGYNTSNLGGNKYWNCLLSAVSEFPGWIFSPYFLHKFGRRSSIAGVFAISSLCSVLCPTLKSFQAISVAFAMLGKVFSSSTMAMVSLYTAELYPTGLRNTGIGLASTTSRVGCLFAPFIAFAGETSKWVPFYVMSGMCFIASIASLLLPETKNSQLPESLNDALALEQFRLRFRVVCKSENHKKSTGSAGCNLEEKKMTNIL